MVVVFFIIDYNDDDSECDSGNEFILKILSSFIHCIVNNFWKTFKIKCFILHDAKAE